MSLRTVILQQVLLAGLVLLTPVPNLNAQITGDIEAEIPFQFVVADTVLSPGNYVIHPLGGDDPAMEVRQVEGGKTVVVLITRCVGGSSAARTELFFNKYGDQEFLSKVLVEGNEERAEMEPSRAETALRKDGHRAQSHALPARYRKAILDRS